MYRSEDQRRSHRNYFHFYRVLLDCDQNHVCRYICNYSHMHVDVHAQTCECVHSCRHDMHSYAWYVPHMHFYVPFMKNLFMYAFLPFQYEFIFNV